MELDQLFFEAVALPDDEKLDLLDAIVRSLNQRSTATVAFGHLAGAIGQLRNECSERDWDGYDAQPVNAEAVKSAIKFAHLFSIFQFERRIATPEISATPTGGIIFQWHSNDSDLIVGVNSGSSLTFSIVGSEGRVKGSERFANKIPESVQTLLSHFELRV
ncbi:MAG: hypothetical protein NUW37_14405 [Planctomycetes bacterium]|nr:hypothetical protein [Planctomycetota bacterium]